MSIYVSRTADQRIVPKWLSFINYKSERLNISRAYVRGTDADTDDADTDDAQDDNYA